MDYEHFGKAEGIVRIGSKQEDDYIIMAFAIPASVIKKYDGKKVELGIKEVEQCEEY